MRSVKRKSCIIYTRPINVTCPYEGHYLTTANYLKDQINYIQVNLQIYFVVT